LRSDNRFADSPPPEMPLEDLLGRPVDVMTEQSVRAAMRDRILGEAVHA
jgi:predicted nucleotidyltransferase